MIGDLDLDPVMFAMNSSIARTSNQTPFEVVFGQQPRMDDHVWKCIKSHLKDKQHDEPNHIILEEDLPADIFDIIKQVNDIEGPSVDDIEGSPADRQTINSNEEPICTNVTEAINTSRATNTKRRRNLTQISPSTMKNLLMQPHP